MEMNHPVFISYILMALCCTFIPVSDTCNLFVKSKLTLGNSAELICQVEGFSIQKEIYWFRESELIAICIYRRGCKIGNWENSHLTFVARENSSAMIIKTLNKEDMVNWRCQHNNEKPGSINITNTMVKSGPLIIYPVFDKVVYFESFILVCEFPSYNEPVSFMTVDGEELVQCTAPRICNRYSSIDMSYSFSSSDSTKMIMAIHFLERFKDKVYICTQGKYSVKYNVDFKRSINWGASFGNVNLENVANRFHCTCIIPGLPMRPKIEFLLYYQQGRKEVVSGSNIELKNRTCFESNCTYISTLKNEDIESYNDIISIGCTCSDQQSQRWHLTSSPIQLAEGSMFTKVGIQKMGRRAFRCFCILPLFKIIPKMVFYLHYSDGKTDVHLGTGFKVKDDACTPENCTFLSFTSYDKFYHIPKSVSCGCSSWNDQWKFNITTDILVIDKRSKPPKIKKAPRVLESVPNILPIVCIAILICIIIDTTKIRLRTIKRLLQRLKHKVQSIYSKR